MGKLTCGVKRDESKLSNACLSLSSIKTDQWILFCERPSGLFFCKITISLEEISDENFVLDAQTRLKSVHRSFDFVDSLWQF